MTVWTLARTAPAPLSAPDELDDFMAELDAELKAAKRSAAPGKTPAQNLAAAFAPLPQVWFPHACVMLVTRQTCACGSTYGSVDGMFLEGRTRNGASRLLRADAGIPEEYRGLLTRTQVSEQSITLCPDCIAAQAAPATALAHVLVRSQGDFE